MAAGVYDITVEQGVTFVLPITWKDSSGTPVNLSGYSARMQIREEYDSQETLVSLTSPSGGIVLGGALGTIVVTIAASVTQTLRLSSGVYDLEVEIGGVVTRLLQGAVTISREVTR